MLVHGWAGAFLIQTLSHTHLLPNNFPCQGQHSLPQPGLAQLGHGTPAVTWLQRVALEFFWSELHWVSAGFWVFPWRREDGLVCLHSQIHVFSLQPLQRLLCGAGRQARVCSLHNLSWLHTLQLVHFQTMPREQLYLLMLHTVHFHTLMSCPDIKWWDYLPPVEKVRNPCGPASVLHWSHTPPGILRPPPSPGQNSHIYHE